MYTRTFSPVSDRPASHTGDGLEDIAASLSLPENPSVSKNEKFKKKFVRSAWRNSPVCYTPPP